MGTDNKLEIDGKMISPEDVKKKLEWARHQYGLMKKDIGRMSVYTKVLIESMMRDNNEVFDLVFLWKQNDSGLYGRRSDMIFKEFINCKNINRAIHFDAPIDIKRIENIRRSNVDELSQEKWICENAIKGYNGTRKLFGHNSYTYIYKGVHESRNDYQSMEYYMEYVKYQLKKNEIGKDHRVILWNSPVNYRIEEWIDLVNPDVVITDIIDDQRVWYKEIQDKIKVENNYIKCINLSDLVFCNSNIMYDTICRLTDRSISKMAIISNGCEEFDNTKRRMPDDLKDITGSIIGYVGNLESKVDFDLIEYCAKTHPEWNIILIGSTHACKELDKIKGYKNIMLMGVIPYEDVKDYISNFDVAIIPHKNSEFNKAMNPLKLYVYISLGIPVVSMDIPGIEDLKQLISIASDRYEFVDEIERALNYGKKYTDADIKLINDNSWDARFKEIQARIMAAHLYNCKIGKNNER